MEERLRINDNIKTAMMLAVVLYHSCMFFTGTWFDKAKPIYKAGYLVLFAKYLNTFHVQTFAMAAGFLFYALRKEKNKYRNNLKSDALKRAKRLLLPYVCTIAFWVLPFYIVYSGFDISKIMHKYVFGCAPSQLWFLPMLFWNFIVYYVTFAKYKPNKSGLIISALISIGGDVLNKLGCINLLQLVTAVQYGMFYYLGAYLYENETKFTIKKTVLCSSLSISGYVLSLMLSNEDTIILKMIALLVNNIGCFSSILAVYGIANILGSENGNSKLWNILKKNSFGIYLFHQQLIYPCIMLLNGRVPSCMQVLICFIIAICGASIITEILRKIKITEMFFGV